VRGQEPLGLAWRLAASLALVVIAGAVTLLVVALIVAPQVFHAHLHAALGGAFEPAVQTHVDEAFANAILIALGVAVPVALLTAFAVAWVVAQRLGRSVAAVAAAADRIAGGDLRARVAAPGIGPEFARLAAAFNAMADRLAETESTRRRLIGDLAHELRTPLASLEATMDAVVDGVLPADAATMATLQEQTDRLSHLVADMATVSRAEERQLALNPEPLSPTDLVADVVAAEHARFAAARVRLDLDVLGQVPTVRVDAQRLGEALGNLLDNALRHTPPGGQVRVLVRADDTGGAVIEVSDTGEGFDPADVDRIFERFYRGEVSRARTGAGSGVGLTIARAIVEAHGGTLTARSDGPGTGATFRLHLPTDRA
jgi:signal transduction histidine kinase